MTLTAEEACGLELLTHLLLDGHLRPQVEPIVAYRHAHLPAGGPMGFMLNYSHLAQMIPTTWTIVDLGCGTALQAWYFRQHRAYVGVDIAVPIVSRLHLPNATHSLCRAGDFLARWALNPLAPSDQCFCIANMAPPWHGEDAGALARQSFPHCFTYYGAQR